MTYIFDSTTHPTLSKKWTSMNKKEMDSSFENLNLQMKKNKIKYACAMGLDGFENYDHKKFIKECFNYKNLIPIAGLNPFKKNILSELKLIKKLGFKGVKIHPRLSKINIDQPKFNYFLKILEKSNLVLMLCTYPHAKLGTNQKRDFISIIYDSFRNIKKLRTILVHGGSVNLLNFSEFVRNNNKNFLLDLSMTMQKYKGSSIENDIKFLFRNFDERICIGSDHPEFTMKTLRSDFNYYSKGLSNKKKKNIAYQNLFNFFFK